MLIKLKYRYILFTSVFLGLLSSAFTINQFYITNSGRVNFKSEAPLEIIKASSTKLTGILNTENNEFVFSVPMKSFEGFNSPLQRVHFNENYIESEKYPEARFKGKIVEDINYQKEGNYKVRAKGKFTVHGKENPMTVRCDLNISKTDIQVNANFEVLLKDYNIQIPTIVNQKLAEKIDVSVKFVLKPKK